MPKGIYKRKKPVWNKGKIGLQQHSEITKTKMSIVHKGKRHSKEAIKKMSETKKGKYFGGGFIKGHPKYFFKHTEETRRRLSQSHSGEKANNWKGGITPINKKVWKGIEMKLWREAVFARDNWTCQKTKIKGGKLHPHHILGFAKFPELRTSIENGITLSVEAHKMFHKKYGYKNHTKEQLLEFLST